MKILVFSANSVDPDQTPRIAASDQGLHYLPMSLLDKNGLMYSINENIYLLVTLN